MRCGRSAWFLATLCAAAGCKSPTNELDHGNAAAGGAAGSEPGDELLAALRFEEQIERRGSIVLGVDQHRAEVDYKSVLKVHPDQAAIRKAYEADSAKASVPTETEERRLAALERVPALIEAAKGLATAAATSLAAADARRRAGELDVETTRATQELLRRESNLRLELMTLAQSIVEDEVRREPDPPAGDEFDLEVGRRLEVAVPDDAAFDFEWLRQQLPGAIEALRAQAVARREAQERSQLALQLSAKLHSAEESAPLHVENYDDIAEVFGAKTPRISLGSPAEQAQLHRELEAIDGLLRIGAEARDAKLPFIEGWKEWARQLRSELDATMARLEAAGLDGSASPATLDDWLAQAIANIDRASPLAKESIRKLEWLRDLAKRVQRVVAVTQSLSVDIEARSPAGWLAMARDVRALSADLRGLVEEDFAQNLAESLRVLVDWGKTRAIAALEASEFATTAQQQLLDSLASFRRLAAPIADALVLVQARMAPEAVRQAVAGVEPVGTPRPIDEIVDGSIRLDRSLADRGDEIDVAAVLYRKVESRWVRVDGTTRTFSIDRFGFVSDLSADVAFISQRGTDHFRTAPSAAWTMHWRRRDTPDDDGWDNAWELFDPGIGVSVVGISTDDESFQPGVGCHLSFFHDIVKVGGGVNLGADDDRDYWFIGIGLFEAIDGIGNLFGMGGARSGS